jgi:hypothetical protein
LRPGVLTGHATESFFSFFSFLEGVKFPLPGKKEIKQRQMTNLIECSNKAHV